MNAAAEAVAVVIPAHQAGRFLGEAIESVLAQDAAVAEIVVVDDGSTDDTAAAAARYPVRLVRQERRGAGAARAAGLAATSAPVIGFLDADDRWLPLATRVLWDALAAEPGALCAFGAATVFHDGTWAGATNRSVIAAGPVMLASTCLLRRTAFDVVGPFADGNTSMVDWFARAVESGRPLMPVEVVVAERRIHDANTSAQDVDVRAEFTRIVKASLDRRRAQGGGAR